MKWVLKIENRIFQHSQNSKIWILSIHLSPEFNAALRYLINWFISRRRVAIFLSWTRYPTKGGLSPFWTQYSIWNIEPFFDLPARYSIHLLVSLNYFRNSCLYELSLMRSLYPRKAYKFNFMFGLISPWTILCSYF